MPIPTPSIFTLEDLARRWNISTDVVKMLIADGKLQGLPQEEVCRLESEGRIPSDMAYEYLPLFPGHPKLIRHVKRLITFDEIQRIEAADRHYTNLAVVQSLVPETIPKISSTTEYIERRRVGGVCNEIIAAELYDKFHSTYLEIARALGLENGDLYVSVDALKQRAKRTCQRGRLLIESKKPTPL